MAASSHFWAFISYSSRDKKVATWLRKRLEGYPIPKIFQDYVLADGTKLGSRIKPVFRDRDELTGSSELGPSIYRALEQSRYLIVLCSKNSARSRWVNKEIEDFQAMGRKDRILALILDGEPNASGNPNFPDDEECFPPALRYPNAEPIAGDLRKEADGKERGFLKVLAGVAELNFDALYRRHERAQRQRRMIIGSVAALVIAALAGLSWFAMVQRTEAVRHRGTAEERAVQLHDEGVKMAALLEEAAKSDQVDAERKWIEGDPRGALAHFARAARYRPDSKVLGLAALSKAAEVSWEPPLAVMEGHTEKIICLAFSPDGKRLATGSVDNTVRIWDVASGREVVPPLSGHSDAILEVEFSADSRRLLTASMDCSARLWDVATGKQLLVLPKHSKQVRAVKFSPDGAFLLTGSGEGVARVWDASSGVELRRMGTELDTTQSNFAWLITFGFSHDARCVLIASPDHTARLYDTSSGAELAVLKRHEDTIYNAIFSPDGRRVMTGSEDHTARIWDTSSGEQLARLEHSEGIEGLAYSPDGQRVLTGASDSTAKLWDVETGKPLVTLKGHSEWVASVAFSPDGLRLLTGSHDGTARIWSADSGQELVRMEGHSADVRKVAFSPDGRQVVTGSWDGTARLWSTLQGQVGTPLGHPGWIDKEAFNPEHTNVVTGFPDGSAAVYDVATGEQMAALEGSSESPVASLELSPDGEHVLLGSDDGSVRLWEIASGKEQLLPGPHPAKGPQGEFSPDGRRLVTCGAESGLRIWDVASASESGSLAGNGMGYWPRFSPDGRFITAGFSDEVARVWDAASGRELYALKEGGMSWGFSPDSRRLANGTGNSPLLWDVASGKRLFQLDGHRDEILCHAFSPDSRFLATGSRDQTVRIWDIGKGELVRTLIGHKAPVKDVCFSPDGRLIVTGTSMSAADTADDATVRLWDASSGVELARLSGQSEWVEDLYFSDEGRRVLIKFHDKRLRMVEVPRLDVPLPEWFADFLTLRCGKRLSGQSEMKELDAGELKALAERLRPHASEDDAYGKVLRWALVPVSERSSHPADKMSRVERAARILSRDTAQLFYRHAYTLDPGNPLVHLTLAGFEENEVSAGFLRRYSLDRLPDDPALHRRAADLLQWQEQWQPALDYTDRVLARLPDDLPSLQRRAALLDELGRKPEALEAWEAALRKDEKNTDWLSTAAIIASQVGKHEEAMSLIDRALAVEPESDVVWRRRGWCWIEKGDWSEALASFKRSGSMTDAPGPSLRCGLTTALWKTGDEAAAVESFKLLIENEPEFATADHIKSLKWAGAATEVLEAVREQTILQNPGLVPDN